jgi:creatinine amidohydrolase
VSVSKQTGFNSGNGSSGEPQKATADKGRHLFEHAVQALVLFLRSFAGWPVLQNLKK